MPPRRRARAVASPEPQSWSYDALPVAVAQRVFALLPVDTKARVACVCRTWRDAVADPQLWTRLNFSSLDLKLDVWRQPYSALRSTAQRAQGQLEHLNVSGTITVPREMLLGVLAANPGLRKLCVESVTIDGLCPGLYDEYALPLDQILAAAPMLQAVDTAGGMSCASFHAADLLRVGSSLRMSNLKVHCSRDMGTIATFTAALSDAALQPTLSRVSVFEADLAHPQTLDSLVDAALARRLPGLALSRCPPPAAASLARLLNGDSLTELELSHTRAGYDVPLLKPGGAAVVAEALRVNRTLKTLKLNRSSVFRHMGAANSLLNALVGHPSLRELSVFCEGGGASTTRGALLALFVAADAPALESLDVYCNHADCQMCLHGDVDLGPLVRALARNRHLRRLHISHRGMTEGFATRVLLPAVQANTGLRELNCSHTGRAVSEARELVKCRAPR